MYNYLFLKYLFYKRTRLVEAVSTYLCCVRHFMSTRKEDSQNDGPAMFVATAYDEASEAWTSQRLTAAVSIS